MKRIIIDEEDRNTIKLSELNQYVPIFAKRHDTFVGMIVKENAGWILRTGGSSGATGHHSSLRECIENCLKHDYEFFA